MITLQEYIENRKSNLQKISSFNFALLFSSRKLKSLSGELHLNERMQPLYFKINGFLSRDLSSGDFSDKEVLKILLAIEDGSLEVTKKLGRKKLLLKVNGAKFSLSKNKSEAEVYKRVLSEVEKL
jgi:hypothetical protein